MDRKTEIFHKIKDMNPDDKIGVDSRLGADKKSVIITGFTTSNYKIQFITVANSTQSGVYFSQNWSQQFGNVILAFLLGMYF